MTTVNPTVWSPSNNNGEYSLITAASLVDTNGTNLVDTNGNTIIDSDTVFTLIATTVWSDNAGS